MERVWMAEQVAISVMRIDFIDPKVAHEADARERGVRIEVRPVTTVVDGTVYASWSRTLQPGICRVDFLESAPGAADRMHWHPEMHDGEPGDRTFENAMPADPLAWLTTFLRDDLRGFLVRAGVPDDEALTGDLETIRSAADEVVTAVGDGLAWARQPWPDVDHDERGMAILR